MFVYLQIQQIYLERVKTIENSTISFWQFLNNNYVTRIMSRLNNS